MSYASLFLARAKQEFLDSWVFYEDKQQGLGDRFKDEVFSTVKLIEENPDRYPIRKSPYHEKLIDVFPFLLIYRIEKNKNRIIIVSVFHAKRNPSKKYEW